MWRIIFKCVWKSFVRKKSLLCLSLKIVGFEMSLFIYKNLTQNNYGFWRADTLFCLWTQFLPFSLSNWMVLLYGVLNRTGTTWESARVGNVLLINCKFIDQYSAMYNRWCVDYISKHCCIIWYVFIHQFLFLQIL